jgi:RNA 3'-terminal phosphate cyclase (ATP)
MSSMRISTPPGAVCIDGAQLEGGGQILRNAAALAAVLVRPLFVHSIRAGRSKPGLAPQHATGLQLVAALCCGVLDGAQQRSSAITLTPTRPPRAGDYVADTTTAGSVTLLAQQALPCLFLATERPGFAAGDAR